MAIVLILAALPAAARASGAIVTVRVGGSLDFTIPDKNAPDPKTRADRAVIDAFEREHPNIRLVNANGLQIKGPAGESNLLMAFAGGNAPDVVYVNFRDMENYIQQGFLVPLDGYLARDPRILSRIHPLIRHVITVDGHVYALPYAQFVQALYYRKDLFEQAGLDPNRPPRDWNEFYDDCRRITNQPKGVWGFEWPTAAEDQAYWWINILWQAGGEVTRQNAKGQWIAAFDTPQGVAALEFYKHLVSDPYISPIDGKRYIGVASQGSPQYSNDEGRGKVAMWFAYQSGVIANTADATAINPSLLGIAPMPKGPTGISANEINAAMWAISSQTKSPTVREASWQFIKFMGSDEADRIRTQSYVQAGLGDLINPASLIKYGYADEISGQSASWLQANKTLFDHGHPEPYGANMQTVYQLLGQPLEAIALHPDSDPRALLADATAQIDDKLIGYTPPAVMQRRREVAWTIFGLVCVAALALCAVRLRSVVAAASEAASLRIATETKREAGGSAIAWLFMAPAIVSIAVWAYLPLARGLVMAFQDYRIVEGARWVGLDNFIDASLSYTFWIGIVNAIVYTLFTLAIGFFLPILLAVLLNEIPRGTLFFRFLFYLPAITASLVVSLVWCIFEDGTANGLLNQMIGVAHIPPQQWLGDTKWAMLGVVLPGVWATAGPGCIIYLAALKGIPLEYYEAADLDGAGVWTKIVRITLPQLAPLIVIQLVGAVVGAFQVTDRILAMTDGGPLYATHTIGLEIWESAFLYLRFGYATAAAWMMGTLLIGFTILQLRTMRNVRFAASGRS
jgi:multiple sugar transport system permease protein